MTTVQEPPPLTVDWTWQYLSLISRIPAFAWGAITPRGPVHHQLLVRVGELAQGAPFPSAPHEAVLGARLFQGLARLTLEQGRSRDEGLEGEALVLAVRQWCDTGWPDRWVRPTRHWDEPMLLAGGALAAARMAAEERRPAGHRAALAAAADLLARAAVDA